jgi:uncharacterized protein
MKEEDAIALLREYASSDDDFRRVLAHSQKVKEVALKLAEEHPYADREFIKTASILHDIGRFKYPPWKDSLKHGVEGSRILRREGLPKHALVAERHIGAGIPAKEIFANRLLLPKRDFMPVSIEEKIIALADCLVEFDKRVGIKLVYESFKKELGTTVAERLSKLYHEVTGVSLWNRQSSGKSNSSSHRK